MADVIDNVKDKSKKIEQLQREKAKKDGRREQIMKQLKDDFGVESLSAADKEIEKLCGDLVQDEELLKKLDREMGDIIDQATPKEK